MKIKIIENEKPNIQKINFACDEKICEKLDKFPMVRDNLNQYNTTVIIGRQGSGKTSLTINIVKKLYKKKFHKIYVFMPQTSRNSLKPNIFEALPEEQLFEELNHDNINLVYEELKKNSENGHKSLIIMDDVQKALKDNGVISQFKNIVANQRHLKVCNIILLQNYFSLDNKVREIVNNVIFFKMDKKQTEKIFSEVAEMKKEVFDELINLVFDEPHNWCMINQRNKRIYKLFDEIVIENEI
jgi:DNA replication protein DnaC